MNDLNDIVEVDVLKITNMPEVEDAIYNAAYDYYMSYLKDDMKYFKEISKDIDDLIYNTLTYPNMIAYVNYCKVAAANEILNRLFKKDFELKPPAAVPIDESYNELLMEHIKTNRRLRMFFMNDE